MLFKLLGAPLSIPMAGMKFVFKQLADLADQELNDESALREQLLLLQVQFEEGDVEEEDFVEQEAALLAHLREIKARKRAEAERADVDDIPVEANTEAKRRLIIETPFDE
jgi:hypothetical protein